MTPRSPFPRLDAWLAARDDHRTPESREAARAVLDGLPPGAIALGIGGGPGRAHPRLTHVNVIPGPGVEVAGDAHALPFAAGSVHAIHCEAVLEHLADPAQAVAEMHRVLRAGGEVFAATPFLQAFHAHPDHFQNFTLSGHRRLFERAGFELVASGVCVGPMHALADLIVAALATFTPGRWPREVLARAVALLCLPLRPLDRVLARSPHAARLCATTFVRARKAAG